MNAIAETILRVAGDLRESKAEWALVGGLAVSARTTPRFTADIDLAVAVGNDAEAEAHVRSLMSRGYQVSATVEQEAVGRLATARLLPPSGRSGVVVDLLFASSGIEPEIVRAADAMEIMPDVEVLISTTGHLLALKILSRDDALRPQDRLDALTLLEVATPQDLVSAREALATITARGFHRNRDLLSLLEELITDSKGAQSR